jgi:hypothetical protein
MVVNRVEDLHSFLSGEGRELVNIKFIPGTSRGLTDEQLAEEARSAIGRAFAGGLVDKPPRAARAEDSK